MTYIPVVPAGGNAGWAFLQRTRETQQTAFESSGRILRDTEYFVENIGKVKTAEDLMSDRRLLSVALGAFGLDEDIGNKFFIRKVLQEGTLAEDAFANKLSDKRYKAMAKAFGFDLSPPQTQISTFADTIVSAYKERQFEIAVGEQDDNLRLVMGFERELANVTKTASSADAMWYTVMSAPPLRKVFDGAFNLPLAFGTLDVDRQLDVYKQKAEAFFGTSNPKDFLEPERMEELTRRFLVQADLQAGATSYSSGSIALTLLQSVPSPYGPLFG